jgi:tetratricopeptide (TPR) repeat protein
MKRLRVPLLLAALGLAGAGWALLGRTEASHGSAASKPASEGAAAFALQAYERLIADGFSRSERKKAMRLLNTAKSMDPAEPRIAIALSQAALNTGYASGSRYRAKSYQPVALDVAEELARKAAAAAPDEPLAHVQLAKIQIIRSQHREAWGTLDRAYRLDQESFHPWFLRGVISYHMKDAARARKYFDEAERFTARAAHYGELLAGMRADASEAFGDFEEAERMHRLLVARHPPDVYHHYNYGLFLEERDRLREALDWFHKAQALGDFPLLQRATARVEKALGAAPPDS